MKSLEVNDLQMHYKLASGKMVRAIDGVNFWVDEKKTTALIGESGCGKSSIGKTLLRILPENGEIIGGSVLFNQDNKKPIDLLTLPEKEMVRIRGRKITMVFQGAMSSFNPVYRVGDQITEGIIFHEQTSKAEAMEKARKMFELVGIDPGRMRDYPHQYSGGMRQRAVIAMALITNPKLIIADEPTTALDLIVQDQILQQIKRIQGELGMSMIFISHDISVAFEVSDRVVIMYAGKIVEDSSKHTIFKHPLHPYTQGLLRSHFDIKGGKKKLSGIPGEAPNLIEPVSGCRFADRCPIAKERCRKSEPELVEKKRDHWVACHFAEEVDLGEHK